jgi:phosphatidylserine/phosphatidylglycerophosphate/cardiolipin synthase-like enzyme
VSKGIRGIEPVIEEIIDEAIFKIHVMAYILKPSALKILKLLERAAERGVRVTMVINNLGTQDPRVIAILRSIAQRFPHFKVVDFHDPWGTTSRESHSS